MCGIVGVIAGGRSEVATIRRMTGTLRHRGPDDEGYWLDSEAGVSFGHRRLAVVDLSANGRQPMVSHDGRYVLVLNGEIYNHAALRESLTRAGQDGWRGRSDSETLVEAIAAWGLRSALRECVGMFALALWDRHARRLYLARDRFGEKPLYYGRAGRDFVFASELKALGAHPDFQDEIDRDALAAFAARGYVPAPRSIFTGVSKLEPGTILALDPVDGSVTGARYWSYRETVESGLANPFRNQASALSALEAALATAIRGQSVADVPVGMFLSGGVDSSTIAALWRKHLTGGLTTYAIGFEEAGFDEAPYARAVAQALGTDHREHYVTAAEARAVIPMLPSIYDEPFADPSQIPTYLLSRLARDEVIVALSGDGGDELFGGYTRYRTAARLWRAMRRVPPPLRHAAGALLSRIPAGPRLDRTFHRLERVDSLAALYASFRDEWTGEPSPVLGATPGGACPLDLDIANGPDLVRIMYCDATSYLPGDLLCKVDRAAMAHGLEVRIPFLDHRVAAVAAGIPLAMKMTGGGGKQILKQLLFAHLPAHLFARPKAGFSVPVGAWLKGPLKSWASDLLARERLDREGYFDGAAIERRWRDHLAGRRDATFSLWPVLMFHAWLDARPAAHREAMTGTYGN